MAVLALVEPDEELSLQALSLARDLGEPLHALTFDAAELGSFGVETVHVAKTTSFPHTPRARGQRCLDQLIEQIQPTAVVAAGTNRGNEVLAHLAAPAAISPSPPTALRSGVTGQ